MALATGTRLGPYEVGALLGAGGMGEVYRAHDTKLHRDVALKVLPDLFADDPERLARFQREAEVLASLNHPNIASIYGLEETAPSTGSGQAVRALVLELVEGPTLADRIAQGPMPLEEALPIARQIAEAFEAAHERGVIHRDLKPANVKVKPDGMVKVLDFGLAKALEGDTGGDPSQSPTLTAMASRAGVIMGTAAYMSPEQARGSVVDKRADIWAFGAVLYEMLTGRQAFGGQTISDTLAWVLARDPDLAALPTDIPPGVRKLLGRCLDKDPKRRLRDIGEARFELEPVSAAPQPVTAPVAAVPVAPRPAGWRPVVPWTVAALIAGSLITGLTVWSLTRPGAQPVVRFPIPLAADETFSFTGRHIVAISPTGTHIVYTANGGLSLRPLDQLRATPVSGTEAEARSPFFSPDGQSIGFYAAGQLKKVSVSGGAPVTLGDANNPWGASWGADDMILYGQGPQGIWQVPGTGGTPAQVIPVEDGEQAHGPQMLPGGEWVLFTFLPSGVSSWDQAQIVVQSLETDERTVVIDGGRDARHVPTGHLVYALNGVLLAVPFDLGARRVTGGPVPLVEGVADAGGLTGAAHFSVATNGSLVYSQGARAGLSLVWVGRDGREEMIPAEPRPYSRLRVSPDGTRVAVEVDDPDNTDVWIWHLTRETLTRLTFDAGFDSNPIWTPDGSHVVFFSDREGGGLFRKAADGTGEVERLMESPNLILAYAWAADERLIFAELSQQIDVGVLALEGDRATELLLDTEFAEQRPALSSDGRWLAYTSNESGQGEIYVRPFPNIDEGKWQVSTAGGTSPVWSPDGQELFYRGPGGLMVVTVETEPAFSHETPESLFSLGGYAFPTFGRKYDISPEGQRFLFLKPAGTQTGEDGGPPQLIVVENWFEELKQRVAPN